VRVELHPEARAELRSAALWYDERRTELGDRFVGAVHAALEKIGAAPESFPQWLGATGGGPTIRKATLSSFPYLIAFERHREHLLVLGIAHQKRQPLYWLHRASRSPR
jgi:plasmid stabilization system protein ParE